MVWATELSAAAETPVDGDVTWSLAQSLSATPDSPTPEGPTQAQVLRAPPMDLGTVSGQGPEEWYVGEMHFRLTLPEDLDGILYVSANTNGQTFAQLKYDFRRIREAGGLYSVSTATLLEGGTTKLSRDRTVEVTFENYLRAGGVRPGMNEFNVQLERIYGAQYTSFTLANDATGITKTRDSPEDVKVTASSFDERFEANATFGIPVQVVGFNSSAGAIAIAQSSAIRSSGIARIDKSGRATVKGVADKPGKHSVKVRVSLPNRRTRVLPLGQVNVAPARTTNPISSVAFAVAGALALAVMVAKLKQRSRRSAMSSAIPDEIS